MEIEKFNSKINHAKNDQNVEAILCNKSNLNRVLNSVFYCYEKNNNTIENHVSQHNSS